MRAANKPDSTDNQAQKSTVIIDINNLKFVRDQRVILDNIKFSLHHNEIVTIVGPNGAGKSSLIKIILGLVQPTSGSIKVSPNLRIGYMPQRIDINRLMPISVARFLRLAVHARADKIAHYAELLNITHLLSSQVLQLSGGEFQRVLLVRALLNDPTLLILDEPTQAVDIHGQIELYKIITTLRETLQIAVLMISHDLHLVMSGTEKVICLNKHICCSGKPDNIITNPEFIRMFGESSYKKLALYTHNHDHAHDGG
jgi:zinc transport system ATP-binding protein